MSQEEEGGGASILVLVPFCCGRTLDLFSILSPPSPAVLQPTCVTTSSCTARTGGRASTTCGASARRPTRASCARSSSASGTRAAAATARPGRRGPRGLARCSRCCCWRPADSAEPANRAGLGTRHTAVRRWNPKREIK